MKTNDARWRPFAIRRLGGRHGFDLCLAIDDDVHVWRFPHGLPYNPAAPRKSTYLGVRPLSILEREGPSENDGEPALIWDRGTFRCEDDAAAGVRRGKLRVELAGYRTEGTWAVGRGKGTWRGRGKPWTPSVVWDLVKVPDEHAGARPTQTKTSIDSNLDLDDLDGAALGEAVGALIKETRSARRSVDWRSGPAALEAPPCDPFTDDEWLFELRRGERRLVAARYRNRGVLVGPDGVIETDAHPAIARAIGGVPLAGLVIEGTLEPRGDRPILHADDILACGGRDVRDAPLEARKAILERVFSGAGGPIRYCDHLIGHGEALAREVSAGKAGTARVIARRRDAAHGDADARRTVTTRAAETGPRDLSARANRARMTNRDKIFWPTEGLTKGHLLDYYRAVSDALLPTLADRPLVLTRFPDGIDGKSFFQHHAPGAKSAWLRTVRIRTSRRPRDYFVVEDADDLIYLVNLGTIPLHVWPSRASSLERPDWCTIDIDRSEASWEAVVEVALALRELCESIGLPSFIKTSGGDGLHVCIPLGASLDYDRSRLLGELLARTLEDEHGEIATTEGLIARRGGKVYLDHLVNARGRMLVAPYSARAKPGATVSTPLSWSEVDASLDPGSFTILTVPARLSGQSHDPWDGFLETLPDLAAALEELAGRVAR